MSINFLNDNNTLNMRNISLRNALNFKGLGQRAIDQKSDTQPIRKSKSKKENTGKLYTIVDFQEIYNMSNEEIWKFIKFYTSKRAINSALQSDLILHEEFENIDTRDNKVKELIKEHNKTTPITAGKYFKKENGETPLVPLKVCVQLGFGTKDEIIDAIKSGKIKGYKEENQDNPNEEQYFIDINSFKSECYLKQMRAENKDVVELSDFALKTGLSKENIIKALKRGELVIIRHFLFETDRDKVFISLKNPKNAEYLYQIGYKNTSIV